MTGWRLIKGENCQVIDDNVELWRNHYNWSLFLMRGLTPKKGGCNIQKTFKIY